MIVNCVMQNVLVQFAFSIVGCFRKLLNDLELGRTTSASTYAAYHQGAFRGPARVARLTNTCISVHLLVISPPTFWFFHLSSLTLRCPCFQLVSASSLKPEVVSGVDLMIVRELVSGIYFGEPRVSGIGRTVALYYSSAVHYGMQHYSCASLHSILHSKLLYCTLLCYAMICCTALHYTTVRYSEVHTPNAATAQRRPQQ